MARTQINIVQDPSSRVLEEAISMFPSTIANMRQLKMADAESKRSEARLAIAQSQHEQAMKETKQKEIARDSLVSSTSDYDYAGLSNPERWVNNAETGQESIFSQDMPDFERGRQAYIKGMASGDMPANDLNYTEQRNATDASFMAKKVSVFNSLVDKLRRDKTAEGWNEKQIMREVDRLYGGDKMYLQYKRLESTLAPGMLPIMDYSAVVKSRPWFSSDLSEGKISSWAFDKDVNPETGQVEGWSDPNWKGITSGVGTALATAWWLYSRGKGPKPKVGLGSSPKPTGAGAAGGGGATPVPMNRQIPINSSAVPRIGYPNASGRGNVPIVYGRQGATATTRPPGGGATPIVYGRQGQTPIVGGPRPTPTAEELLNSARNMNPNRNVDFINKPWYSYSRLGSNLGSKTAGLAKASIPFFAPTIGQTVGGAIGGEEGEKWGRGIGTAFMAKSVGGPAGQRFLGWLATKFPKMSPSLAKAAQLTGKTNLGDTGMEVFNTLLGLGMTTSEVLNLISMFNAEGQVEQGSDKTGAKQRHYTDLTHGKTTQY